MDSYQTLKIDISLDINILRATINERVSSTQSEQAKLVVRYLLLQDGASAQNRYRWGQGLWEDQPGSLVPRGPI